MEEMLTNMEELYYVEYFISQLMSLAITAFTMVCTWKIYSKAGEPGWACFIPFYNEYINFKVAKKKHLFIPYLISTVLFIIALFILAIFGVGAIIIVAFSPNNPDLSTMLLTVTISGIIVAITMIALLIINIIHSIALANTFNQGVGFSVGLIFIPVVFRAILAFSNNIQYNFENQYISNLNADTPTPFSDPTFNNHN